MKLIRNILVIVIVITGFGYTECFAQGCTVVVVSISGPSAVCADGSTVHPYSTGYSTTIWEIIGGYPVGPDIGSSVNIVWTDPYGSVFATIPNSGGNCYLVGEFPTSPISNAITGPSYFCAGASARLWATHGDLQYQWKRNSVVIPGATSVSYYATQGGQYSVVVSTPYCSVESTQFNLTEYANPASVVSSQTPAVVVPGALVLATSAGNNYQWFKEGIAIPLATDAQLLVTKSGNYSVTTSESHGCYTASSPVTVTIGNNVNFSVANEILIPGIKTESQLLTQPLNDGANIGYIQQAIAYSDLAGKTTQTISRQASPSHTDIISQAEYDEVNRQKKSYLPIVSTQNTGLPSANILVNSSTGNYVNSPHYDFYNVSSAINANIAKDAAPFAQNVFEPSPLGRIIDKGSVGSNWQPISTNQYNSIGHATNPDNVIYKWTLNASTGLPEAAAFWPATALIKNTVTEQVPIAGVTDPVSESYTDMLGLAIVSRTQDVSGWVATYNVYDTKGRLRYILPPALMAELGTAGTLFPTQDQINRWAFQYQYDDFGRVIRSKSPGTGWSAMVYDKRDRPVLSQSANQATVGQWNFIKYDQHDRPVITGLYNPGTSVTRDDLQTTVNALSGFTGYQNLTAPPSSPAHEVRTGTDIISTAFDGYREYQGTASISLKPGFSFAATSNVTFRGSIGNGAPTADIFPTSLIENLSITYYDDYKGNDALFLNPEFQFINESWQAVTNDPWQMDLKALSWTTGMSTKVVGSNQWLHAIMYYDKKGRVIQSVESTHLGDVVRNSTLYDFAGKILETKSSQSDDYNMSFQLLVNTSFSGTALTKTTATNAWDAGASSVQQLAAGIDGSIETTITSTASIMMLGLSDTDTDVGVNSIDYGFRMNGNALEVIENGMTKFTGVTGSLNVSDVIKIQRVGTVIYYLKNDKIVFQSTIASTSALLADVSIYSANGVLSNVRSSFTSQGISFVTGTKITQRFEYDHTGRVLKEWHKMNLQPEVLVASHAYNQLGEEIDTKLHSTDNGTTWLQSIDYKYNIKGWLTSINGVTTPDVGETDYFAMELGYQDPFASGSTNPRYDGMISAIKWKHDISTKERLYNFGYDELKRLTASNYKARLNPADPAWTMHTDRYSENIPSYDANGNIKFLNRYKDDGVNKVDQLVYEYGTSKSNQLLKVTDNATVNATAGFKDGNTSGNDYAYDANGNLTQDLNKGITSIGYNFLNLPITVTFTNGSYISYAYDAGGTRLSQTYFNNLAQQVFKIDYSGPFVYVNNEIGLIFTSEGRLVPASYQNLIANKEANGTEGYSASGNVTISSETISTQTYVKAVCNENTGTPGIFPIGGNYAVKAGEKYSFKVLGYRQTSANAYLKVTGNGSPTNIVWTGALLPQGSANENWVTTEFIIPTGVTQIQLGVAWSSPAINETFYINRVALYKVDWEYQYFLNDHQGSQRVVLGTNQTTINSGATFETEAYATETTQFLNINSGFIVTNVAANATPGGNEVIRMNNTYRVGPARSMKVFPGDKIDAQVKAYYASTTGLTRAPLSTIVNAVAAVLIPGNPAVASEISNAYTNSNGANGSLLLSPDQGSTKPSAYLNYILFDEDYKVLEAKSTPLGSANVLHSVVLPQVQVKELGYLFVYLSYDNENTNWVHFDELKINHQESPVLQVNTYFPYGMTAYSWIREGERENLYGYQGKEYDSLTQWNNFGSRQYEASLGRWFSDDPQGNKMPYMSNYAAMMSNPALYIDPNGECPICLPIVIGAYIGASIGGNQAAKNGGNVWEGVWKGALMGGISGAAGYWAGGLVAAQVGTLGGFAGGAITGAASGATYGFVQGAGTAWLNGASLEEGLKSGLVSAAYGGITGGIIGGMTGGVNALIDGKSFWHGGTTMGDKFQAYMDAHMEELKEVYGESFINDPRTRVKPHRFWLRPKYGDTMSTGELSGLNFDGHEGTMSRIRIRTKTINEFYRKGVVGLGSDPTGTIVHEFQHAYDNYTGYTKYIYDKIGYEWGFRWLEHKAALVEFIRYGTGGWNLDPFYSSFVFHNWGF